MDKKKKQEMSKIDICNLCITPALKDAGHNLVQQLRREASRPLSPLYLSGQIVPSRKDAINMAGRLLTIHRGWV